ncbi:receptor-type tyrosine-protein kinase FLT3 isoform X1 [Hippocampus zosterae]|uniref:receptor-type tyrosine-protein kinase FLT3 isoform X1 n=1 Tax=Hippocampus zosterae TaxID=109293 RepID=UPI00223D4516|nr:receptor-type tyrosine-protein kinase FLT3 isoform X1 [Hippocampus zosterae]
MMINFFPIRMRDKAVEEKTESTITSIGFTNKRVMCCATNSQGRECSQLYDYDIESNLVDQDEVSSVILSPGEPLLLRCRFSRWGRRKAAWEKDGLQLTPDEFPCSAKTKVRRHLQIHVNKRRHLVMTSCPSQMCSRFDSHGTTSMAYWFVDSVDAGHGGTYTCRAQDGATKSVDVSIQAEGFLRVQLDARKTLLSQEAASACLQASVFYHPVLQRCMWETPDGKVSKCDTEDWVTTHRTVKLCGGINSGEYKLHVEAGGKSRNESVSVCVVDEPKFKLGVSKDNSSIDIQTASAVPANYTWMSCFPGNESCEGHSFWKEIPGTWRVDSDVRCRKIIKSATGRELLDGHHLKFCLANSVGSWCTPPQLVYYRSSREGYRELKVGSAILVVALIIVSVVLVYTVKKKKPQYQPQLQMIQMVGPNDNDYIYINFKDFEYEQKWEFPRENLQLGKELGSGAFGMVVQATAYGIKKAGVTQQVAVKMLKEKHQQVDKEALMSELKMLTHIGHHVNIVNLLGACTGSGPIYLIFEYCCYGDLLNYLKSSSERYHKSAVDAFTRDCNWILYHNLKPGKDSTMVQEGAVDNYMRMHPAPAGSQEYASLLCSGLDNLDYGEDSSAETESSENGEPDDLQALTFDDLLSFAVQVAKGMDFLSSKNCIHRDLAARNVLVTKGRQVKIADFGLARDIDNDSNYVVRGNVRLPVKWMAPESIFQGLYTMKSDVWAYGILLWEIFSLGVTPYPGIKVDHGFYCMIERGFKMECPYYADESVYRMMCKCWALDPCNRPPFSKLVDFMSEQLTVGEENLYHTINQASSDNSNAFGILDASTFAPQE